MPVWAKVALAAAGAALAFVGALSALSITRAFGVVFLGSPRSADAEHVQEVGWFMRLPLLAHGAGVVALGVVPALGLALVEPTVAMALAGVPNATGQELAGLSTTLTRIGTVSAVLVLVVALVWWWRRAAGPSAQRHVTWGCGYTAPNARMQYTGSSFSWDFIRRFRSLMVLLNRHKAPEGYFPQDAYVITDCVDAVERRLYSVIGHGDASAKDVSRWLREDDPRIAFAAGLVALVAVAGLVVLAGGPLR